MPNVNVALEFVVQTQPPTPYKHCVLISNTAKYTFVVTVAAKDNCTFWSGGLSSQFELSESPYETNALFYFGFFSSSRWPCASAGRKVSSQWFLAVTREPHQLILSCCQAHRCLATGQKVEHRWRWWGGPWPWCLLATFLTSPVCSRLPSGSFVISRRCLFLSG